MENTEKQNEVSETKKNDFQIVLECIKKENINPKIFLHISDRNLKKVSEGKEKPDFFFYP